ncbi:hypothetical protein SIM91_43910 [Rhodococcus opacus]|uniref:hypothetical protein n=1 Tax=Rhodococcus opacus TaxID=37919 RepID=UPI0002A458BB|nr:hypothetical protein [Rhodococcus opacus]ELB89259.1 putative membrane protein [Rhodococcus wratislaviensis IFP 2016]MDX5970098.1 hypothetical protein [Rhodococcus opacus]CAG7633846.1 hypothetical protein E143388_07542 [Rhodococcus opacus]
MNTRPIEIRDLNPWWVAAAFVCGCVAVVLISPIRVLVAATLITFAGLLAFHTRRYRRTGARAASVSVGLAIPALPLSVLHLVDSL